MSVTNIDGSSFQEPEAPEVKMIAYEFRKLEYIIKHNGGNVDLPVEIVQWPWQATHRCKDFGADLVNGKVVYIDSDLQELQVFEKRVKFWSRVYAAILGVGAGLLLIGFGMAL